MQGVMGQVTQVLQRNRSLPQLQQPATSEQLLRHVLEVSEILRTEFIDKQCLAMEAMDKCLQMVQDEKQNQLSDLNKCDSQKDDLIAAVRNMSHKLDTIQIRQNELTDRVESVLKKTCTTQPQLSKQEKEMKAELMKLQKICIQGRNSLNQLQERHQYQTQAIESDSNFRSSDHISRDERPAASPDEISELERDLRKQ